MRTRLELQTAPNSAIGTIGILIGLWEAVAEKVEELMELQTNRTNPTNRLILWRMVYNWHQQSPEEFETQECPPVPTLFGTVSLVSSNTLWEINRCNDIIQFGCNDVSLVSSTTCKTLDVDEQSIAKKIASSLGGSSS